MSKIFYAIQDWHQLPADRDWLNCAERARLDGFRFEKRRRDWLLGRWAAKVTLLDAMGLSQQDFRRIEIATEADGAPLPLLDGRPCRARLSISHSNGRALAAASMDTRPLGCDLELVEPRGNEFIDTWFTESERALVLRGDPQLRDSLTTMIWSAKESTLKALRAGLRIDTRRVEVVESDDRGIADWNTVRVIADDQGAFNCLWRFDGEFILSIVTRNPAEMLKVPARAENRVRETAPDRVSPVPMGAAAAPSVKTRTV